MQILLLIVAIILTQLIISWIGSCLNDMQNEEIIQYAYFYFSKDRNIPMTKNILMNIFISNIIMVFLYDLYKYLGWNYWAGRIWLFTLGFYVWRCILICLILRRREFYKLKYELGMALVSVIMSVCIYYFFLMRTESLFIKVDELREELGFAIIVVLYGFIKKIINHGVKQKDILAESDLENYIHRKFDIFFNRYKDLVRTNDQNTDIWIILFSIMIVEDFNRGPEKRLLEYLTFPFRKNATLGIMQIRSDKVISSKESVLMAYDVINSF